MTPASAAFLAEAAHASAALATVGAAEFARPTRCPPWTVAALVAHVGMATDQVNVVLAQPAPGAPDTDAAGYDRPDERFSPATNRERVDGATAAAARAGSGAALAARFERTWRDAAAAVAAHAPDRVVRTRHGDAMRLDDFLVTRVFELVVHGLDLADALDRPPWTDDAALDVVVSLLTRDRMALVRAATGRGTWPALG